MQFPFVTELWGFPKTWLKDKNTHRIFLINIFFQRVFPLRFLSLFCREWGTQELDQFKTSFFRQRQVKTHGTLSKFFKAKNWTGSMKIVLCIKTLQKTECFIFTSQKIMFDVNISRYPWRSVVITITQLYTFITYDKYNFIQFGVLTGLHYITSREPKTKKNVKLSDSLYFFLLLNSSFFGIVQSDKNLNKGINKTEKKYLVLFVTFCSTAKNKHFMIIIFK